MVVHKKKNKPANKYHILILVGNMGGIKLEIALRPVASLGALYQTYPVAQMVAALHC